MKIAITINTSWNIYNFRMGLVKALMAKGHQVIAIAPKDAFSLKLQNEGCEFVSITMDNTGTNPLKDYKLYKQLKQIYSEKKPDIIFHYTVKPNIYGSLAAHALKIPVINNVSGLGTVFLSSGLASFVAKKLYQKAFLKADLVFFQNTDDQQTFLSHIKIPNLTTDLLPGSGINLKDFSIQKFPQVEQKTFLMIARLLIDKGVNEYIEAAEITKKKYPKSNFQLLGKLDENHARGIASQTINAAVEKGIIEYLGEVDDVKPFIQKATCIVLPSYREGTPRTLLEASALGRPMVTTNVPGCKEVVVNEENGLLCKVKDSENLAEKLLEICNKSNKELELMGMKGRKLVERKFDEQIVINQYLNHVSNIMNQITSE